jgi:hypothetical protein
VDNRRESAARTRASLPGRRITQRKPGVLKLLVPLVSPARWRAASTHGCGKGNDTANNARWLVTSPARNEPASIGKTIPSPRVQTRKTILVA